MFTLLTHSRRVTHKRKWNYQFWFRLWLIAWSAPSHYLNKCRNIVKSNLRNKRQWNRKRNSYIFIPENAFENVVCDMRTILFRPRLVDLSVTLAAGMCLSIYPYSQGLHGKYCVYPTAINERIWVSIYKISYLYQSNVPNHRITLALYAQKWLPWNIISPPGVVNISMLCHRPLLWWLLELRWRYLYVNLIASTGQI